MMLSVADSSFSPPVATAASSQSSSSSSLRRSISTPTTLFSFKTLTSEDSNRSWKHNIYNNNNHHKNMISVSLYRLINKISAESFAKQLTLIDWKIFSKIKRDELKPGQWTGSMKHDLSPNVVLFTKRFNIVTYWAIDEILCLKTPKQRAEIISFFIKLINHLIDLHNLHSSYAIKSALNSASVHRLEKTWNCLSKKDRQSFEKIDRLFSEADNSNKLRTFMETALKQTKNSNCIPNLATYLRDIIHIDSAFPQNDTQRANLRQEKLELIYSFIEKCQQSNYDEIEIEDIHNYLVSLGYIEELQKFREDNYFKTSLKLEPDPNNYQKKLNYSRFSSHYDIRALQQRQQQIDPSTLSSPPYHNQSTIELNNSDYFALLNKSFNGECVNKHNKESLSLSSSSSSSNNGGEFKMGHRKTYSLETNLFLSTNNNIDNSSSNNNNHNESSSTKLNINLIDDSPIIDDNNYQVTNMHQVSHVSNKRDKKPTLELFKRKNYDPYTSSSPLSNGKIINFEDWNALKELRMNNDNDVIHVGCVNRKAVLKDRKKPSFSSWKNCHLRLTNDSLLFFNNKSNNHLKETPKKFSLLDWKVFDDEYLLLNTSNINKSNSNNVKNPQNVFTLADNSCSTIYKIRTNTDTEAQDWIRFIQQATRKLGQI